MDLSDVNQPDGPFWNAYQETRKRNRILDDPAEVPYWFLRDIAGERVAAARIAAQNSLDVDEKVVLALRVVEDHLRFGSPVGKEQVVAALLGAEEIETAREGRAKDPAAYGNADPRPAGYLTTAEFIEDARR